jgi:1,4-dihydroxy-2-naphthoate octaprenyltransferase
LKNVLRITRANFLPLAVVIVFAGLSAAYYSHLIFHATDAGLALIGAVLLHASVNAYNNYFDYRSGIDHKTLKTPFSGGVDIIVNGGMKPTAALAVASTCLLTAAVIGVYFLMRFWNPLLPIISFGAIAIVFYTPVFSKIPALSEVLAGLGFGLIGLGTYVTQTGVIDSTGISILVPVSILVGLLLFLNEFPDTEVDRGAGRKHLVILLGKKKAAWVYVGGLLATYISILVSIAIRAAPAETLLSYLTIPIAYRASKTTLRSYEQTPELIPALGMNVIIILATIALLGVGFLAGAIV